ncbi:MAG: hypothetical protein K1X64_01290 [Myxococcaceae bacterium]|nr:hypothetical protein [Myxococcaceae bacterium]
MRLALYLTFVFLTACSGAKTLPAPSDKGVSTGTAVKKTIGTAGGTLASGDGAMTLDFPAGALGSDTEIGIEPITNTAPLGRGTSYRLTPDGAKFSQPVKMTFKFTADDLKGSAKEALAVAYQGADGRWRRWKTNTRDDVQSTLTQETTHFTDVTRVLGWQLVPFEARVAPLQSLELALKYCEATDAVDPDPNADTLATLTSRCDTDPELPPLVQVNSWTVNGNKGGSLGDGTVQNRGIKATYTAPAVAPLNNPVAVSVDFNGANGSKNLAVCNVWVGAAGWEGTVSWQVNGTQTTMDAQSRTQITVSGNGQIKVKPGDHDVPAVESASATYSQTTDRHTEEHSVQGACTHNVVQDSTELVTGTFMTGASVFISPNGMGGTLLAIGVPSGMTSGEVTQTASDLVTGSGCQPVQPSSETKAVTGAAPSDSLIINVTVANPNRLEGSTTLHIPGTPPREYSVSYNLAK